MPVPSPANSLRGARAKRSEIFQVLSEILLLVLAIQGYRRLSEPRLGGLNTAQHGSTGLEAARFCRDPGPAHVKVSARSENASMLTPESMRTCASGSAKQTQVDLLSLLFLPPPHSRLRKQREQEALRPPHAGSSRDGALCDCAPYFPATWVQSLCHTCARGAKPPIVAKLKAVSGSRASSLLLFDFARVEPHTGT